jgi:hypothetical protein
MLQVLKTISSFIQKLWFFLVNNTKDDCCFVSVTMQAQKEAPLDMQCKDKFLVQTVVVSDGTTSKEVLAEMVCTLYAFLKELSCFSFFFFSLCIYLSIYRLR